MTYKELGQLIQKRRKNLGMTQVELGSLAEVSFGTIQNIELGKRGHVHTLRSVLQLLDLDVKVFIIDKGESTEIEF